MSGPEVERLDVSVYTVPTDGPEADGTLAWDKTTMVLVEAHSAGRTGLGYSYTGGAAATVIREVLRDVVVGAGAHDVPALNAAMNRAIRNLGRPGVVATAISAVDLALWDLKARLLDLPVADVLGRARDDVPVYGSGGFTTYDDGKTTKQLEHWTGEQGIPRVKIKIGESWGSAEQRDLHRVALARRVVGDECALFVDANGGYSVGQAVRVGRTVTAEHGVTWFEEPVSSDDLAGLAAVRAAVDCDVTAGEYGYDLPYFGRMVGSGSVDCLQIDVTRCGGITEFLRAAAVAAAANLQVSGHCAPSMHRHVATAVPNLRHLEWFHDHVRIESTFFDGFPDPSGGVITSDGGRPGHGLELRRADVADYLVASDCG